MATIDITRHATDFRKHYAGLRIQQGRVLSDDDFNENVRLEAEDMRRTRVDVIGPAGSPDFGFQIIDNSTNLNENPMIDASDPLNPRRSFTIHAGSFYLGGQRLVLEQNETYLLQKDWLNQGAVAGDWLTPPGGPQFDLVYLETWQQPVSAIEDTERMEIALGGPDGGVCVRNQRRVRIFSDVKTDDCQQAWAALQTSLAGQGKLNEEFELVTDAKLKVEPDGPGSSSDLCSPPVAGGYLGAENQAIRVQITGKGEFTWGFDNAAPLYRVQLGVDAHGNSEITMLVKPKDQAHWPLSGQVVELLPWSAVLPNGKKTAELHGLLAKVVSSYDPHTQAFTIDVNPPIPSDASGQSFGESWKTRSDKPTLSNEPEFFYLRVWNRGSDITSPAQIATTPGPVSLGNTGVKVTFSGAQLRLDDFWIIAVRPDSSNTFVPWELATNRQPHGVRRWLAPLAIISWPGRNKPGAVVNDCRDPFLPLTRIGTCCTVTVGDGKTSHGQFSSIQKAINSLPTSSISSSNSPRRGGRVCILAGDYSEPVTLLNLHDVVISGCGPRTILHGVPSQIDGTAAFPVISVIGGSNIVLESFAVEADDAGVGIQLLGKNIYSKNDLSGATGSVIDASVTEVSVTAGLRSALRARFVSGLKVEHCEFRNQDETGIEHTVTLLATGARFERNVVEVVSATEARFSEFIRPPNPGTNAFGGVQLQGTCQDVSLIDNLIRGGSGHGITLGSTRTVTDPSVTGPGDDGKGTVSVDPCSVREDFDFVIDFVAGATSFVISEGDLCNIVIERNDISYMGGCGIGVDRFFDLSGLDQIIGVTNLTILGNNISHCLQRTIQEPTAAATNFVGYGGISLADVENLIVRDNAIFKNSQQPSDPVCGFFALHVEGAELSRNRILDNGAAAGGGAAAGTPKRGARGGIVINYALAPTREIDIAATDASTAKVPEQGGVPAAKIHNNIVTTPLGQALSINALGPVSVLNNQFTTQGVVSVNSTGFVASTIWILNLGFSSEFYMGYILFSAVARQSQSQLQPAIDNPGIGRVLANGQVLFANNQVETDFFAAFSASISPILIITLDDLGFHDNQCEANLRDDFIGTQGALFGLSLRVTNNRFKEGPSNAVISALTVGLFANTTALNQSTHCVIVLGGNPVDQFNTSLLGAFMLSGSFKTCQELSTRLTRALATGI
jgi:uncharacterized protein DUF6519